MMGNRNEVTFTGFLSFFLSASVSPPPFIIIFPSAIFVLTGEVESSTVCCDCDFPCPPLPPQPIPLFLSQCQTAKHPDNVNTPQLPTSYSPELTWPGKWCAGHTNPRAMFTTRWIFNQAFAHQRKPFRPAAVDRSQNALSASQSVLPQCRQAGCTLFLHETTNFLCVCKTHSTCLSANQSQRLVHAFLGTKLTRLSVF